MHLKSSLLLLLALCMAGLASAQSSPSPRMGLQVGLSPLRSHELVTNDLGEFGIFKNRAFQIGAHYAAPIGGGGLEAAIAAAYLRQRISFFYLGPGTYDTDAFASLQLSSLLLTPSLAWRPDFAKGFFIDLGLPVALAIGNHGTFVHTTTTQLEQKEVDQFPKIAQARNKVYTGPELGLGFLFHIASRQSLSVRISGWMPVTNLFHANNDLIVTWQQRIRPSLEIGWSFDLKAN